jgi:hypothetical protein
VAAQSPFWQLGLNGSRIRYDSLEVLTAPSVATSVEWQGRHLMARVGGSFTGFIDAGRSLQGRADLVGWFSPAGDRRPLRLELGGSAAGSTHSGGFDAFVVQGDGRAHLQGRRAGLWLGVGVASSENSFDPAPIHSVVPNGGAWVEAGPVRVVARYADTRLGGERYPEGTLSAVHAGRALDLTAFVGARGSPFPGEAVETWYGGSLSVWVRSDLALLVSGGQYASDILQGIPGGDFVSVGIRLAPKRLRPTPPTVPLPLIFSREQTRDEGVSFALPDARSVAIAGDWNAWQAVPLEPVPGGRWRLTVDLPAGVHRFNLIVDGERWVVPDGVPSTEDGFGGRVGLLVISADEAGGM